MDDGLDRFPLIPGAQKPEPKPGLRLPTLVLALVTVFMALSAFLVATGPAASITPLPPPLDRVPEPTPAQSGAYLPSESPGPDLSRTADGTAKRTDPSAPKPTDPAPPTRVPSGLSFGPGMGAQTTPAPEPKPDASATP